MTNSRRARGVSSLSAMLLCMPLGGSVALLLSDSAEANLGVPVLTRVTRVWDQAPHNAFTDLIRYEGDFYLAFREAPGHGVPAPGSNGGDIRVLRSSDGTNWTSAALIDSVSGQDLRDPKLSITPGNVLMLNSATAPQSAPTERQSKVWFSADGSTWSIPRDIGDPNFWMWRATWHDGIAYSVGYGPYVDPLPTWTTKLYTSTDGREYEVFVDPFTTDGYNESTLLFHSDNTAVALVRRDAFTNAALIGTSGGDFSEWTFKDTGVRIGGPALVELPDGRILAGTRLYDGRQRTSLSFLDPEAGTLTEALTLPSGGDTSYPGFVWHDDHLWVSYYSSHEGKSSIYLAEVDFVPPPDTIPPVRHQGANDPTTEGWSGSGAGSSPVFDDVGFDAWNQTDPGVFSRYDRSLSFVERAVLLEQGFRARARLRNLRAHDEAGDLGAFFEVSLADLGQFALTFGSDAEGDPLLFQADACCLGTLGQVVLDPTISGTGYHTFDLVFDPGVSTTEVELRVDGISHGWLAPAPTNFGNRFNFGASDSSSRVDANWNLVELMPLSSVCDFDGSGDCDIDDIDALVMELAAGGDNLAFDINGDNVTDAEDLSAWLSAAAEANLGPGSSYLFGDANLDGLVDISDFNIWNNSKFTNTGLWSLGDFNADGSTDVADFNIWNAYKFNSSEGTAAVPEPMGLWLLLCGCLAVLPTNQNNSASRPGFPPAAKPRRDRNSSF